MLPWPKVPSYYVVVLASVVALATQFICLPEYLSEYERGQETYYEPSSDDDDDASCVNVHITLLATPPPRQVLLLY